jgi:phosphatidylglycerophosphate synthase
MFNGGEEKKDFLLSKVEKNVVAYLLPRLPLWLETYHLTYMTILWSIMLIMASFGAISNRLWIGVVIMAIILQYLTDVLDGAVGRYRKTGLVKWGFYMDHLVDYIFGMSILFALGVMTSSWLVVAIMMSLWGGIVISYFLNFAVSNKLSTSFATISTTEMRIGLIFYFAAGFLGGLKVFISTLEYLAILLLLIFLLTSYSFHRKLWVKERNRF